MSGRQLKIVLINKSDSTGGAAVVSYRLMEALRRAGCDARMLVAEKLTDSPYVKPAASKWLIKSVFLLERLMIFISNGFNRKTLFKIDTGQFGLPLRKKKIVKRADVIFLNWVNQGVCSLNEVREILLTGKPVIWTMHDMWCMTGICHHAGECQRYLKECGDCPLLGKRRSSDDLSFRTLIEKTVTYGNIHNFKLAFVAVSSWLQDKALQSALMKERLIYRIPNPFDTSDIDLLQRKKNDGKIRILFGAARLDDPIKGLPDLKRMSEILARDYPSFDSKLEIAVFGCVKDPSALEGFSLPLVNLGTIRHKKTLSETYLNADILVSASSYETLPGTVVEAQAYGVIPVSFNRGGQADIIEHMNTGYLADYSEDLINRAKELARGVAWAISVLDNEALAKDIRQKMREGVETKFSYSLIASEYLKVFRQLTQD